MAEGGKILGASYVALLRGINVGGNVLVSMAKLKEVFEALGFGNVKTLLASGNVIFQAQKTEPAKLAGNIADAMEKTFKRRVDVIVLAIEELAKLQDRNPFKGIKVTPETRLYVTFLSERPKSARIPKLPSADFKILSVKDGMVCSVLRLSADKGTVDLMGAIEKEFGKKVTTRNWNTVLKIIKLG